MKPTDLKLGTLHAKAPGGSHTLRCVQFAYDDRAMDETIVLASVAGPQTAIKSFAAALNESVRLTVRGDGFSVWRPKCETFREFSRYGAPEIDGAAGQGKYKCTMHRLGYNQVHCTAILKDPRVMPCVNEDTLWSLLRSNRFTTPILRAWMPWLMARMLEEGTLVKLPCFQCEPGLLLIDGAGLDELVSRGVSQGHIDVPGKEVLCSS